VLGLRPAPEFEQWLQRQQLFDAENRLLPRDEIPDLFKSALRRLQ
jgi:ethanolamine ammonia-lyase large subunit